MKLSEAKPLRKSPRKFRGNGCIVIPSVARNLTIEVGTTQNNVCEATSSGRSFASLRMTRAAIVQHRTLKQTVERFVLTWKREKTYNSSCFSDALRQSPHS